MSTISIGSPTLPLERDLASQLEDVPMVEVVISEDREAVVNADGKKGRRNDGEVTKQKTNTANLNRQRKKHRRSLAQKSGTTPKTNQIHS